MKEGAVDLGKWLTDVKALHEKARRGSMDKVVGTTLQAGYVRVSLSFGKLEGPVAEKLEMAIFDLVLAQLGS